MTRTTRTEKLLALIENTKRAEHIRPARKSTLSTELIENNTIEQLVELVRLQHEAVRQYATMMPLWKAGAEALTAFNKFEQGGE